MTNATDIARFIEQLIEWRVEKPHHYALHPTTLEAVLTALEEVREFVLTGMKPSEGRWLAYSQFLVKKGFDSNTVTGRAYGHSPPSDHDWEVFNELCNIWREFMVDPIRVKPAEELKDVGRNKGEEIEGKK